MPRDAHHTQAVGLAQNNRATILTTEFVIVELVNFFSGTNGRSTVTNFVKSLRNDPDTIVIPAASELLQRGFELFSRRLDKEWSLTDCISFVVMEEHGVTDVLTSDADFEQAGFKALLI
jgi:predicted nucleic acid-binding protein